MIVIRPNFGLLPKIQSIIGTPLIKLIILAIRFLIFFGFFYILLIWIVVQTSKISKWLSLNRLEKPAVLLKRLLRELN